MRKLLTVIGTVVLVATLVPAPASAQPADTGPQLRVNGNNRGSVLDLPSDLTKDALEALTAELGSVLRFRQAGDPTTLERGKVEVSLQFAHTSFEDSEGTWSTSFPQMVARFGLGDRVDLGAWGGFNSSADYGVVGVDTKIALMKQGPSRPVSISIRPSFTSLVGPSDFWAGTASLDVSVSRAFGAVSPYVGVATSGSLGAELSDEVSVDPVAVDRSVAYAGVSYRWRALVVSAEVEKGTVTSHIVRVGTRF